MALVSCKECQKEISDQAEACPQCGCPVNGPSKPQQYFDEKGRPREPYDWELEKAGLKPPKKKRLSGKLVMGVIGVLIVLGIIGGLGDDEDAEIAASKDRFTQGAWEEGKSDRAARREQEQQERDRIREEKRQAEAREEAEEKRQGMHCLSAWDGSHIALKRLLKENARNPDSFEHMETRITPVSESGTHTVFMKYRAQNGFGGMSIETQKAVIRSSDCGISSIPVD